MQGDDLVNVRQSDLARYIISQIRPGGTFGKYKKDPVGYARDVLGVTLTSQQEEFLQRVAEGSLSMLYRLAVRSGHGVGKTFIIAVAVCWYIDTHENAIIATTAPTFRQVKSVLWREIHRLRSNAKTPLPGNLLQTELYVGSSFAMGFSTDDPTRFQGLHSENILIIEDESPGVPATIHHAIEGILAGGGIWCKVGNPTSPSGPFYDCFRSPTWDTMHFSCLDHINVTEGRVVIPGAVTKQWCEDRLEEWGEDSPMYQSRVLGEFPEEGEDTLIRLSWAERSFENEVVPEGRKMVCCDVARYGQDFTVIGLWHGDVYRELHRYNGKDLMQTCGHLIQFHRDLKPETIVVDDDGLGGGVTDRLLEQGFNVLPFKGGERANDPDRFFNRRASAWWELRERLKDGTVRIEAPDPDSLKHQLTAPRYSLTSKGQIKLETKDEMKKRGVRSPDRADCMAMGCVPLYAPLWSM